MSDLTDEDRADLLAGEFPELREDAAAERLLEYATARARRLGLDPLVVLVGAGAWDFVRESYLEMRGS